MSYHTKPNSAIPCCLAYITSSQNPTGQSLPGQAGDQGPALFCLACSRFCLHIACVLVILCLLSKAQMINPRRYALTRNLSSPRKCDPGIHQPRESPRRSSPGEPNTNSILWPMSAGAIVDLEKSMTFKNMELLSLAWQYATSFQKNTLDDVRISP